MNRVLIDARPIDHPTARQRGIGRYVTGLLYGMVEIGAPVVALSSSPVEAEVLRTVLPDLDIRSWAPSTIAGLCSERTWYIATQLMLHPIPMDPIPSMITEAGLPVAAVMYDVIPYRFPDRYQSDPNGYYQAQIRAPLARTCDAMLAISEFSAVTAAEELAFPRNRIATIGAGVEPRFRPAPHGPTRSTRSYVISVSGSDERKNTEGLIIAWSRLPESVRSSHQLVVVAATDPTTRARWEAVAAEAGVAVGAELVLTGAVHDDELVGLLQAADLAVMPSFEEGFGLPILEAVACGVPAISSDRSSLPEVLGDSATLFDPYDPDAIAGAIVEGLTDAAQRQRLLTAGRAAVERWTWANSARATMEALETFTPRWRRRVRPPRARMAIAGPFEHSTSGIGTYNVAVREALRRRFPEVEWHSLVDNAGTTGPVDCADCAPVRGVGRYEQLWHFDDVVATLGSSPHHVATVHSLAGADVHMWLHEASLVGVHVGLAHQSAAARSPSSTAGREYLDRHLSAHDRSIIESHGLDVFDAPVLDRSGVSMLNSTIAGARSIIVSSELAARRVADSLPDHPPILVLPLAHRSIAHGPQITDRSDIVGRREVIVAGWLAPGKLPMVAVEAVSYLRGTADDDPVLRFVGPVVSGVESAVLEAASRFGIAHRVVVEGPLDAQRYASAMQRAAVAVQLREIERGEQSAAITDLLAAGVPVITNMSSHAPGSPGLRLVDADATMIAAEIDVLLGDPDNWAAASNDARARARAWSFDDAAVALMRWLGEVGHLPRGTVQIGG